MCGRFSLFPHEDISVRYGLTSAVDIEPRYNISPSQDSVVITEDEEGRKPSFMKWGMVLGERSLINIRCESLLNKPHLMDMARGNRCIIPVNSFYEWRTSKVGRVPYMFYMEGLKLFSLAGLWRKNPVGPGYEFTVLTTRSEGEVARIHNRMPIVLTLEQEDEWLSGDAGSWMSIVSDVREAPLKRHQISPDINDPANEGRRLIEPVSRIENWS